MILNLLSLMLVSTNDFKNETVLRLQLYNLPANTNFYRILLYHRVSLSLKSRETSLRLTLKYSFSENSLSVSHALRKLLLWQFICFIRKLCCLYPSNKSPIIFLPHFFTFDSMCPDYQPHNQTQQKYSSPSSVSKNNNASSKP